MLLIGLVDSGIRFGALPDNVVFGAATGIAVILAYLPSRYIYLGLRWKAAEFDGRYCPMCEYDITGNVSGICPECGSTVPQGAISDPAPGRSTDVAAPLSDKHAAE